MEDVAELTVAQLEAVTGQLAGASPSAVRMAYGAGGSVVRTAAGFGGSAQVSMREMSPRSARFLHPDRLEVAEVVTLILPRRHSSGNLSIRCAVIRCDRGDTDAGSYAVEARFVRIIDGGHTSGATGSAPADATPGEGNASQSLQGQRA
jgi:hypothetical protein